MTFKNHVLKLHPAALLLASFVLAIVCGTLLLKLPISADNGYTSWLNALFTATSAVCVTGLVVVDTGSHYSLFGQLVILACIQVGGLGVMTISVFLFRFLGRGVSFRQRLVLQDIFAHTPREDIFRLLRSVMVFTLVAEALGALLLTLHWMREYSWQQALYNGVFHAISAFCNAGFALFPDSMTRYGDSMLLNTTVCGLIIMGGIGFPVLYDIGSWLRVRKFKRARLSVHTKTVLLTTGVLIVAGALLFALLEHQALRQLPSITHRVLAALFQSITCRTAGFNTMDIGTLQDATLAVMLLLMFFGASPGSCGGGVKTTTLALLTAFTISRIRRGQRVNMFRKSIPTETVTRSISLILVSIGIIGVVLFMLLAGDSLTGRATISQGRSFLAYFFETVSAFGTVGLSMGITPDLTAWGKLWIILTMIVGRIGVLTFAYIIVGAGTANGVQYSEENLMIG